MPQTHINLEDFPDSPYAHELQRTDGRGRFSPPLEAEYIESHLHRMQLRVRVWFSLELLLTISFTLDQVHRSGLRSLIPLLHVGVALPASAALAWLSWTRMYQTWFLSCARLLVPLYASLIAVFVSIALSQGREEQLAGLTVDLIAVFFFAGLMYRDALLTACIMVTAFLVTSMATGLAFPQLIKAAVTIALTSLVGIIVARDIETSYRKGFLEGALIGELAARDGLSGLMNRRTFDEHLLRVWQHALRDHRSIALLMIDIDHFKQYNDTLGHQAGDVALRSVARAIQEFARRPLDLAARYGGEEFTIILYDLPLPHVNDLAERLRQRVAALRITAASAADSTPITISIGVALASPTIGRTPQGVVQLADEALYEAKSAGRNRIAIRGVEDYGQLDTGSFRNALVAHL